MTAEDSYLLAATGRALWSAACCGSVPPLITQLRDRMRRPQPGDVVLEISRWGGLDPARFDPDSVGRLVSHAGDRWVVEPLHDPGRQQGWRNADFIALPSGPLGSAGIFTAGEALAAAERTEPSG